MTTGKLQRQLLKMGILLLLGTLPALAQGVVGIAKKATVIGRDVRFDFYVENLGIDDITGISVNDDLDAVFGAGNYVLSGSPSRTSGPVSIGLNGSYNGSSDAVLLTGGSLLSGETAQITVVVTINTPADVGGGFGIYSNQVTVNALDAGMGAISDISDNGTDPDPSGNGDPGDAGEDDPTPIVLFEDPEIGIAKQATPSGNQVTLDFYLENFGNVTLFNLSVTDDLDATFGAGNYSILTPPALVDDPGTITPNAAFDGSGNTQLISSGTLAVADTASIRVVVNVDTLADVGNGLGVYSNQATAFGQAPAGATDTDLSDNGTNPDPNGDGNASGPNEDDPTPIVIGEEPSIGVAKTADISGNVVTMNLYLENLGNVTLDNLSLTDDLNSTFGAGNYFVSTAPSLVVDPGGLVLNAGYDGNFDTGLLDASSTFASAALAQIQFEVTVVTLADLGSGLGVFENQAVAYGEAPGGANSTDLSDDGTDPDPNGNGFAGDAGEDDPTAINIPANPVIGLAKQYVYGGLSGANHTVYLRFYLTNYGNQRISSLTISENLNAVYGAGNYSHLDDPAYITGATTLNYNASFNGNTNTSMLNAGSYLDPGESVIFQIGSRVTNVTDQGFGLGIYQNQVTVNGLDPSAAPVSDMSHEGNNPDPDGNDDPTDNSDPTVIDLTVTTGLGLAKDVSVTGSTVTFDLYLENTGNVDTSDIGLVDNLNLVFGTGNWTLSTPPFFVSDPGTLTFNPAYGSGTDFEMLDPTLSTLAVGDTAQIQFEVTVTNVANQGLGLGNYSSQADVVANTTTNTLITDLSDFGTDPDPDGDGMPNEAGENDATTFSLAADSPVGVALNAGVAGTQVTLDMYLENLGPSSVDVSLTNVLDDAFGAGNYTIDTAPFFIDDPGTLTLNGSFDGSSDTALFSSGTLAGGDTAQIQMVIDVHTESDQGGGYGVYSHQLTVSAVQPSGVVVSDVSDNGTDPDPNGNSDPGESGEDDATAIVISVNPVVGIAQQATVSGTLVTINVRVENLGDCTLTNFYMENPLNPVFGSGNYSIMTQPFYVSGASTLSLSPQFFGFNIFSRVILTGSLRPGETEYFRYQISVNTVTDQGNGFGIYHNSLTVTATAPDGTSVMDVSDDGTNPDPNDNGNAGDAGEDDQTVITIGDEANVGIALDATVSGTEVTLDYYIENFGGSTLSSFVLQQNLDDVFGAGNYSITSGPSLIDDPGTFNLNGSFDGTADLDMLAGGTTLAAMDTAQIRMVVDVTNIVDQGLGLNNYENQVSISAQAPLGAMTEDLSDDGTDPDPTGNGFPNDSTEGDVTAFSVFSGSIGAALDISVSGREVTLDYTVTNLGNVAIAAVSLPHNLDDLFGAGNYTVTSGPTIITTPREFVVNSAFNGSTQTNLLSSGGMNLGVTEVIEVVVTVNRLIDPGSGLGVYSTQVTVDGDGMTDLSDNGTVADSNGNSLADDAGEDDPSPFTVAEDPAIGAALTASVSGAQVTFDYYLENLANVALNTLSLTQDLDAAFGAGTYSINSGPSFVDDPGTLTLNAGFDGSGTTGLLTGGTLAFGDTAQIRVVVDLAVLTDQGSGVGVFSTQATAGAQSPDASVGSDLSDSGTNPDANGNNDPGDAGEDDATNFSMTGATVGDLIYNDLDGDGVLDGGEPGLAGVTLYADLDDNGSLDGVDPSATTDGSGAYDIVGLVPGTYNIRVASGVPMGFVRTAGSDPTSVTLTLGADENGVDLGYQQQDATIGDFVYNDFDGNGTAGGGEAGISGVTVFLDLNGNGVLDGGEPTDVTDGDGLYDFTGLPTGTYSVRLDPTTVPMGFVLTGGTNPHGATIAAGEDYNTADFGLQQQDASIGDYVWEDLDGDGLAEMDEPGLAGVRVYLDTNSNGMLDMGEPNTLTDADGLYDFTNLPMGTYSVTVDVSTLPAAAVLTTSANPVTFMISPGDDINTIDFGFQVRNATIGDLVWEDLNGDGVIDAGEPGLAGVTVFLDLNTNGTLDMGEPNDTTDAGGAYDLTGLAADTYSVRIDTTTLPAGVVLTGGTDPVGVTLAKSEDYNDADFGYQYQNASIGDFVWEDLNGDGVQDGGEPGIAGITVFLDTNSNGTLDGGEPNQATDGAGGYDFTGLAVGTYSVQIDDTTLPAGVVLTGGTDPVSVNLAKSEDYNDADFGYQYQDASIGDFVWEDLNGDGVQDGGEPGIAGVTVFLDLNTNGSLDGGEPTAVTDAAGAYDLTGLAVGSYSVQIDDTTLPAGAVLTGGTDPTPVSLAKSEDYNAADFGYQVQNASIGDFVWEDLNGDGVQDAGEPGLAGVTVFLDLNTNGALDGGEPSAVTDAAGAYDLTGLAAGTYSVQIDDTTLPAGVVLTGGTDPVSVTLAKSEDYNTADFGYQYQNASIGDFVWEDLDGDGVQDGGELGIAGITVFLDTNGNGTLDGGEPNQATDGSGGYDFTGLPEASYNVQIDDTTLPAGLVLTGGTDPTVVALAKSEDHNDADFGYQYQDASIGDFVWEDLNGDGVQDGGEPGISGITVFLDTNSNGTLDGGEPSQVTDGAGAYDFSALATGTYSVQVDDTTLPAGLVLTGGTDPLSVNLAKSEDYNDADFGYQYQNASIGDFVWEDLNGDGVQDGGEPGISGITIFLDLNTNGTLDGGEPSQVTDAAGAYDFTALPTGTYSVQIDETSLPAGVVLTGGTEPLAVNLAKSEDYNDADFGYQYQNASIGDFVWEDLNGDGVQDGGEPGISGITVFLDTNGNGTLDGGEPSQVTDGAGAYDFTELPTGTYNVQIDDSTLPAGVVLTGGTDPNVVVLAKSEDHNDADFGYQYQNASIGDFLYNDLDGNGVFDAGEPALAGYTVFLDLDSNGTLDAGEPSATTDAAGAYDITGLAVGTYAVTVDPTTITTGFVLTGGSNPLSVNLAKSEDYNDADFGFQQQDAAIGDRVWNDVDGDGVEDAGEPGLNAVTVFIDSNANGTLDAGEPSTATAADGSYAFTDLPLGTYVVRIDESTLPADAVLTGGTNPVSVTLAAGEVNNTADFGYQVQNASIGDFVWDDLNGDGVQDAGEPGLAGITVYIDLNNNAALDAGEPNATSDAAGAYDLPFLAPGTYTVRNVTTTVPAGYHLTTGIPPLVYTLGTSEDYNDADFGYRQSDATVGDVVFNDLDGNGIRDAGEPGIPGVTLYIDLDGDMIQDPGEPARTTGADGSYDIPGIAAGTYTLVVDTPPVGFTLTTGNHPLTFTVTAGEDYNDADFGYRQSNGIIGDLVWRDTNGNGMRDTGEPGIVGVTLEVTEDLNASGTRDAGEALMDVTITNANGNYQFKALEAGNYVVTVTDTNGILTDYALTTGNQPLSVVLTAGQNYMTADFGYRQSNASIGDLVWQDLNADGSVDPGEPGIGGVTLNLIRDLNGNGLPDGGEPVLTMTTTAADGSYQFANLAAGFYVVQVTDVGGVLSDAILTTGNNPKGVNLASGATYDSADFGYCLQPVIEEDPADTEVCRDEEVTLSVLASGSALTYQWRKDGLNIPGATAADYTLTAPLPEDSGLYDCVVTGTCGTVTSAPAQLDVLALSVRFDPAVVVQGLEPVTLEAIIECAADPYVVGWKSLGVELGEFGFGENPTTLPMVLPETSVIRITVVDHVNPSVSAEVEVQVLSSPNPDFRDLNGDGCNTIDDVYELAPDWGFGGDDANGDGIIDIRDFLYIRVDASCD